MIVIGEKHLLLRRLGFVCLCLGTMEVVDAVGTARRRDTVDHHKEILHHCACSHVSMFCATFNFLSVCVSEGVRLLHVCVYESERVCVRE